MMIISHVLSVNRKDDKYGIFWHSRKTKAAMCGGHGCFLENRI